MELHELLNQLQASLPAVTWVEASLNPEHLNVELQGDEGVFLRAAGAAEVALICYELLSLDDHDFTYGESVDGLDDEPRWISVPVLNMTALRSYQQYLGAPSLLRVFFAHQGCLFSWSATPPWWNGFVQALGEGYEQHRKGAQASRQSAMQQQQLDFQRRAQVLRQVLPTDQIFVDLACLPRPGILALRDRARAVLTVELGPEHNYYFNMAEDPIVRVLADEARAAHRRKR